MSKERPQSCVKEMVIVMHAQWILSNPGDDNKDNTYCCLGCLKMCTYQGDTQPTYCKLEDHFREVID
jgi:hypothetical protein